jgi:protein-tyrosine phosphatase
MAEVLLRRRLAKAGIDAQVSSAGVSAVDGVAATAHARTVVGELDEHRSRSLTAQAVVDADLVLAMAREHVRRAVVLVPEALERTFTLRELVRRGQAIGPRMPGEPLAAWLLRVGAGRVPAALLGDDPEDDVADPIGGPIEEYRRTADELDRLLGRLVELLWPDESANRHGDGVPPA